MSKKSNTDVKSAIQVIGMKQIQKLLGNPTGIVRTPTVTTPTAQILALHQPAGQLEALANSISMAIATADKIHWKLAACIDLQFQFGLRVSELLEIKGTDVMSNGNMKIKGLKHSNNRIITTGLYHKQIMMFQGQPIYIFSEFDRHYLYREYKKLGISFQFVGRTKNSVTHAGRHIVAKLQKDSSVEVETTKNFIGHKSERSTEVYRK